MIVSLEAAKRHLRVSFDDDDGDITALIAVAEGHLKAVGVNTDADPLPEPIRHAALLLIGQFYGVRESLSNEKLTEPPNGFHALIAPHREQSL